MSGDDRSTSGITALVPRRLWTHEGDHGVRTCHGVILFADIAGFTRLTETAKLRAGSRGIEELTARINGIFSGLVSAAENTGGDILKFGGDALLVAFDAEEGGQTAVIRALQCAHLMQLCIAHKRRTTLRSLSMHLGMAYGHWQEIVAGIPGQRREHFIWGDAITRAMAAADTDQKQPRIDCPARLLPARRTLGFSRVSAGLYDVTRSAMERGHRPVALENAPVDSRRLWDFVPDALRDSDRIDAFESSDSAEHRRVTSVFAFWTCPTSLKDESRSASVFEAVFSSAHDAAMANNGLWARSDPAGEKQKLLVLFGAVSSATDDVDRALAFAARLQSSFEQIRQEHQSLKLGVGVSTATVFTGFVGNKQRREFTAMGDGVNLAARLAGKAPAGTTMVDATTREESARYRFSNFGTLALKNIRKPTTVFRLDGLSEAQTSESSDEIVEHPDAMRRCLQLWEQGRRQLRFTVRPGADARKFMVQLTDRLGIPETSLRTLSFDPDDASHPLAGIRRLCDTAFGEVIAGRDSKVPAEIRDLLGAPESRFARLLMRIGPDGAAKEIAGQILRHAFPDGHFVVNHVERLGELDKRILEILVAETHIRWMLMEYSAESIEDEPERPDTVALGSLSRDELSQVLGDMLKPARPSRPLVDFLFDRSNGTARLARSFLTRLISEGAVTRSGGRNAIWQLRNSDSVNIPDGLRAHFLQHVDRLPHRERHVLRAISVLGDAVPIEALHILCQHLSPQELSDALTYLQTQGLIEARSDGESPHITVCDRTCRQAVYETMSYQLRESWHSVAAGYWRGVSRPDPARVGEHLFRARDTQSAAWLKRAAQQAQRVWSLDRARQLSRWAILALQGNCRVEYAAVTPPFSKTPTQTEEALFDSLAEILRLQGLHADAGRIHRWRARIAGRAKDVPQSLRHRLIAARMDWYAGQYEKSGRQARAVLRLSRRLRDKTLIAESAYLVGETCRRTGRINASLRALTESETLLARSNDSNGYADVLNALGLLHWNCGRLTEARACFGNSLRVLSRGGDPARRGQVANNIGILLEEQGHLRQAERYYAKAFAVFDRTGVRRHRAYSLGNLANLHRHAARYERARSAYEEVDTELRAIGEAHAAAYTVGNIGDLARDFGDMETARSRYETTLQFAIKSGDEELKAECYARLAHLHLIARRFDLMPRLLRKSRDASKRANSREFALYELLLRAEWDIENHDSQSARRRLDKARANAADVGLVYYQLWADYGRARLDSTTARGRRSCTAIRAGMTRAHRTGYAWWELRFAALGMEEWMPEDLRVKCHERCQHLIAEISSGIGDAHVLRCFRGLPCVRPFLDAVTNPSTDVITKEY